MKPPKAPGRPEREKTARPKASPGAETAARRPGGRCRMKSSFVFRGRPEVAIVHEKEEYVPGVGADGKLSPVKS